jgi:hypothetical protein
MSFNALGIRIDKIVCATGNDKNSSFVRMHMHVAVVRITAPKISSPLF